MKKYVILYYESNTKVYIKSYINKRLSYSYVRREAKVFTYEESKEMMKKLRKMSRKHYLNIVNNE